MALYRLRTISRFRSSSASVATLPCEAILRRGIQWPSTGAKTVQARAERNKDVMSGQAPPSNTKYTTVHLREVLTFPARLYSKSQSKRPYTTQLVSALLVFATGDLVAQSIEIAGSVESTSYDDNAQDSPGDSTTQLDPIRLARTAAIGVIMAIPGYHWMLFLGNNFNVTSKALSVLSKILINQLTYSPFIAVYFFSMQSLLSGQDITSTWQRVAQTVPTTWLNSWKFWPFVMGANFAFVRPQNRSIFAISAGIVWQTYLCIVNQQQAKKEAMQQARRFSVTP